MKILMVCLGNICRSPLAEGILKSKLDSSYIVESAGTIAMHQGKKPDQRSIKVAREHGIDISSQSSRPIQFSDFEDYDRIYCMDKNNLEDVLFLTENEEHHAKVSLLLDVLNDSKNSEVPDPYWGDAQDFEDVFQLVDQACSLIANELKNS